MSTCFLTPDTWHWRRVFFYQVDGMQDTDLVSSLLFVAGSPQNSANLSLPFTIHLHKLSQSCGKTVQWTGAGTFHPPLRSPIPWEPRRSLSPSTVWFPHSQRPPQKKKVFLRKISLWHVSYTRLNRYLTRSSFYTVENWTDVQNPVILVPRP